ncbi:MAG: sulfotransferase domain-containing protein [Solirubrobacteraceae bacterium]
MKDTLDFIVIGAQKAGTTSLFEYLRRHPQISMPADKEAPYFSHDHAFERGWDAYMAKIALIDPERRWGTVTPHYMIGGVYKRAKASADAAGRYDERTVPLRIRERLPDVRLVAILRDPVARARSHHQMMVMNGSEQRSFDEAIAEHLRPDALERARRRPLADTGYVAWGEYRRILGGYFTVFPREQILVAFTDELERSPERLLARVHDFLGVRPDFVPDNLGVKYRAGASERRLSWMSPNRAMSPQGLKRALRHAPSARAAWRLLPKAGRLRIKRDFEQLGYRADLWNRRSQSSGGQPSPETVDRLREHFAGEADELAALLGVSPPWLAPRNGE